MEKQLHKSKKDPIAIVYKYWRSISIGLIFIIPLALILLFINSPTRADDPNEPYSIFILAGQSNAAGVAAYRTELDETKNGTLMGETHPADTATQFWWAGSNGQGSQDALWASILQLGTDTTSMGWAYSGDNPNNILGNRTDPPEKRLRPTLNEYQGVFGSEFGIARSLYDMGRRKVIILKVTYGFQTMAQSNAPTIPFDWNVNSTSNNPEKPKSYQQLKIQFKQLTDYLRSRQEKYTVDGIFWMQGETDMIQDAYANSYQQNFTSFVNAARQDLELHPQGHFVIGKSNMEVCMDGAFPPDGDQCGYPWIKSLEPLELEWDAYFVGNRVVPEMSRRQQIVRNAQQAVADTDQNTSQKIDIFETFGLPRGTDFTHLTAPGQVELGRRFVNMYTLPTRYTDSRIDDYDGDGVLNGAEDTGRGSGCPLVVNSQTVNASNNGNLGDDDSDCDGFPNYLDPGSGL